MFCGFLMCVFQSQYPSITWSVPMLSRHHDPIVAVATAPGRGGVGIVRVSGQAIAPLVLALCHKPLVPRHATYLPFLDANRQLLDKGLAIYFPAPHSYTGEDVLELHAHGGPVVLKLLVARCLEVAATLSRTSQPCLAQLRIAEPGEFTERAFLNNKIDLAQAEAIADLIDASTESAARSAARSMSGEFSYAVNALLEQLIRLRMLVEATLDFPEEDIDFLQKADASGQLSSLQSTLATVIQRATQGAILREGIKVVIAGQPNAGKSSLLNVLAGADIAIVTPIAGTTRDKVAQLIQIEGVPLHIVDTAGLRDTSDEIEKIGMARAWTEITTADAVVFLHDTGRQFSQDQNIAINYVAEDVVIADALEQLLPEKTSVIHVWNKSDLVPGAGVPAGGLLISTKSGDGLDTLRQRLLTTVGWKAAPEGVFMARERHLVSLNSVAEQLQTAMNQISARRPALDLLAEDLRQAQYQLGKITGAFSSDDLLGEIFSRFCIGK